MLRKLFSILSLLLLLFIFSCGKNKRTVYKVGTWKTAQTIQPFFYQKFNKTGKKVKVFAFTNPADQKSALLSGNLDMCGTTIAHAIHSASMGQPVVVVSLLCNKCSALVVRKDSGINKVADLKGKKIGYVPGTMHEILLRELLKKNNLVINKDVELVRVDFFDMGTALAKNNIQAFLSGEPFPSLAASKGYGKILSYPYFDDTVGDINAGMLVTKKAVKQNPEMVLELVKMHIFSTKYLLNNKKEWLKKASDFGTELKVLKIAEKNMALTWKIDGNFVKKAKALGKRMLALGIIKKEPDYDSLFNLDIIKKAIKKLNAKK